MLFKKLFFNNHDLGKFLIRLNVGGLMLFHGVAKLRTNTDFISQWMVSLGLPHFFSYGVYVGEIIAPLFILTGIFVRMAACVFVVNMFVAMLFLYQHGFVFFSLNEHGGLNSETDFLYLLPSIALIFLGGGKYGFESLFKQYLSPNLSREISPVT